jgi:hypothetical protein
MKALSANVERLELLLYGRSEESLTDMGECFSRLKISETL